MTHVDTESNIKFDYSVSTENRFAVRKWLQHFVDDQNTKGLGVWESALTKTALIEGFSDEALSKSSFVEFMKQIHAASRSVIVRFPELTISYSRFLYDVEGNMELYIDGVLSLEGTFESRVAESEGEFQFAWIKLYPRMTLQVPS
jgi:hypothetical protein